MLSNININELNEQYIDYSFSSLLCGFDNPLMLMLKENKKDYGYPLEKVKKWVTKAYHLKDWQFRIESGENNIEVALIIADIGNNEERVVKAMEYLGYFVSTSQKISQNGQDWLYIKFEPKFQDDVSFEIKQKYKELYHLTPQSNLENIAKYGLVPSSKNALYNYPDRIFLITDDIPTSEIKSLRMTLMLTNKNIDLKNDKYVLLVINLQKLPKNIKFYYDTNYQYGVFTDSIIPPQYIELTNLY